MAATTKKLSPQDLAYALPGAFANYTSGGQWRYARHLKLIEDKIMPITRGVPIRLMVSLAPRSGKSAFISENLPAWYLGRFPRDRVILLSYQQTFAQQFGRKARNKLKEFGPDIFGVTVADDAQAVGAWETNYGGGMQSVGAGGALMGKGATCHTGSTMISTSCGNMRIDELVALKNKPQVLSFNHVTGELEYRDVISTKTTTATELVEIKTDCGYKLTCTPEHPVYCVQRGYAPPRDFIQGQPLITLPQKRREAVFDVWGAKPWSRTAVPALLPYNTQGGILTEMFNLLKDFFEVTFRGRQTPAGGPGGVLLQPCVSGSGSWQEMCELWGTDRQEVTEILRKVSRRKIQATWASQYNKTNSLFKLWRAYTPWTPAKILQYCVLTSEVSQSIFQHAQYHQGTGWESVCAVQHPATLDNTPHQRRYARQYATELSNTVSGMPLDRPQIGSQRIESVEEIRTDCQPVYDLQIEGNHNYFANGVLVHNCLIIDDIIKGRDEALNARYLDTLFDWYSTDVRSRMEPNGSIIILNTRWSTGDLVGRLREQSEKSARADKWEEIILPALAEENDPLGRAPGEALWPERFSREDLLAIKESGISDYFWRAVYQQRPTPLEGNLININWFRRYRVVPAEADRDMTVMSFDTASKDNEMNDYTVIQIWAIKDGFYYLLHQVREKMKYPKLLKTAIDLKGIWKPNAMVVEDKGSGIALIQSLKEIGAPVIGITPTQSKLMRFEAETPAIQGGQVFLPEDAAQAPWLPDLEDELKSFPDSIYKDAADCMSQFLLFARLKMARQPLKVW